MRHVPRFALKGNRMAPPPPWPRPLAICIFRKEDQVFVGELYDASKDEVFYRPLGGTIEFGEPAREAVKRELQEEIEAEVINLRYLGALENLFTHEGEFGHEIVLVYEGDFADKAFYEAESVRAQEDDGMTFTARWKPLQEFREGKAPLYPDGLLRLLSSPGEGSPTDPAAT